MISKTSLTKVDPETLDALDSAAKLFEEMGHRVEPISTDPGGRLHDIVMSLICAGWRRPRSRISTWSIP